eukprot:COSAG04_NODE_216_length_19953_cov_85.343558_22_plen_105_part_00
MGRRARRRRAAGPDAHSPTPSRAQSPTPPHTAFAPIPLHTRAWFYPSHACGKGFDDGWVCGRRFDALLERALAFGVVGEGAAEQYRANVASRQVRGPRPPIALA